LYREVQNLTDELKQHDTDCTIQFNKFCTDFEALSVARRIHINEFKNEPVLLLNVLIILFGNYVVFSREEIPFPRKGGVIDSLDNGLDEKDFDEFADMIKFYIPKPPTTWGMSTGTPSLLSSPSSSSIPNSCFTW
jgi:hypothetical protein